MGSHKATPPMSLEYQLQVLSDINIEVRKDLAAANAANNAHCVQIKQDGQQIASLLTKVHTFSEANTIYRDQIKRLELKLKESEKERLRLRDGDMSGAQEKQR